MPDITIADELMQNLASPLEILANLTFLTAEDADLPEKVRLYMRMAEDQMKVIRLLASKVRQPLQAAPPQDSLPRVA